MVKKAVHLEKRVAAHAEAALVIQSADHQARDQFYAPIKEAARDRTLGFEHIKLHLLFVGENLESADEARPALIPLHRYERADHLVDFRRADRTVVDRAELVGTRLAVPQAVVLNMELGAIAVPPRLAGDDLDVPRRFDLPESAQLLNEDGALQPELVGVRRVLVMASSTASEVGTWREDTLRRRLEDFERMRADEPRLLLLRLRADPLPRQYERRKDHAPIEARQSFAAVHQLLHRHFKIAYDKELLPSPTMKTRVFSGMQPSG